VDTPQVLKSNAVDVFGSLGDVHQLDFAWENVGPRLWKFSVEDSKNTKLTQGAGSAHDWSEGIIVGFGPDGKYAGVIDPANTNYAKYTSYESAAGQLKGAKEALVFLNEYVAQHPAETADQVRTAFTTYIGALAAGDAKTGAQAVSAAVAGSADSAAILSDSETEIGTLQTTVNANLATLESAFVTTSIPPNVYAEKWLDETGNEVGSLPSDMAIDLSAFITTGDMFNVQTPVQDGAASTHLKDIRINSDGILSFEFKDQQSKAAWLLPLINFHNNNGLEQSDKNVLLPQPQCGEYILSSPGDGPLGRVMEKMITKSNVDPQETLMKAHRMAYAADNNATLYKMAVKTDQFLLQIFSQL
jgi:flagellar hook protein FlgE